MKMIFVLIILAVILLCIAIMVFFWAVKQRQFDDLDVHAYSVLKDDEYEITTKNKSNSESSENNSISSGKTIVIDLSTKG